MNSKAVGDISEAYIIAALLAAGYRVAKPIGDNCRYDIIIEDRDGALKRVQCKTATRARHTAGAIEFAVCTRYGHRSRGSRDYAGEIDYSAAYCAPLNGVYLIPSADCEGSRTSVSLRLTRALNGQEHRVRHASRYLVTAEHFTRPAL